MKKLFILIAFCALFTAGGMAESPKGSAPLYKVTIESGATKAINYRPLKKSTKIGFRGTVLLPKAEGEALISSNQGTLNIVASFKDLQPASQFGPEYLTYVLWAISPEGRAVNLGELLLEDDESHLVATTQMQSFGLIVTAEPYFAVAQVGNVVVLENVVLKSTKGSIQEIDAHYELLPRGQYTLNKAPADLQAVQTDKKVPFYLYQARNAVEIARTAGAESYAPEVFKKAEGLLQLAETNQKGKRKLRNQVTVIAREAVQTAEDARLIALKRFDQAKAEAERQTAALEITKAKEEAGRESQMRQQAEQEKTELRARLKEQLNHVLETRDSARGLIVNLSDVLFEIGKHSLRPEMREKLAKISGILLSHPGLRLEVEGHTDSIGRETYNQLLSEKRAQAVQNYLREQGIPAEALTAKGFGKSRPLASNQTLEGRQKNRRVEIVISGDIIEDKSSQK